MWLMSYLSVVFGIIRSCFLLLFSFCFLVKSVSIGLDGVLVFWFLLENRRICNIGCGVLWMRFSVDGFCFLGLCKRGLKWVGV